MALGEPSGKSTALAEDSAGPAGANASFSPSSKLPRPVYTASASGPCSAAIVSIRSTMNAYASSQETRSKWPSPRSPTRRWG